MLGTLTFIPAARLSKIETFGWHSEDADKPRFIREFSIHPELENL
jgi:hypothetical protein